MEDVTIYEHSPYTDKQLQKYIRRLFDKLPEGMEFEQHASGLLRICDRVSGQEIGIPVEDVKYGDMAGAELAIEVLIDERATYSNVVHLETWRKP